jgi:hypothetical protein
VCRQAFVTIEVAPATVTMAERAHTPTPDVGEGARDDVGERRLESVITLLVVRRSTRKRTTVGPKLVPHQPQSQDLSDSDHRYLPEPHAPPPA